MKPIILIGSAVLGLGVFLYKTYKTFAIGGKLPLTTAEERIKAFEHLAPAFKRTYDGDPERLAIHRAKKLRRVS